MRAIEVLEEVGGVIHLLVRTDTFGNYEVMGSLHLVADTLVLEGVHLQGQGSGQFGSRELLVEIRGAAKQFGRDRGARRVKIVGGRRRSGANPGHFPPTFEVEVN